MGYGAAGGLLRHQMWPPSWSPPWPPSCISPKLRIYFDRKRIKLKQFFAEHEKCDIIKHFVSFLPPPPPKKREKTHIFLQKLLHHLLL